MPKRQQEERERERERESEREREQDFWKKSAKEQEKRSFLIKNFNHSASYKIKNQKEDKKTPIDTITTWLF